MVVPNKVAEVALAPQKAENDTDWPGAPGAPLLRVLIDVRHCYVRSIR